MSHCVHCSCKLVQNCSQYKIARTNKTATLTLTFFKNLPSNSLPTGKPFQSNAQKFPHPGWHIAVNHSQAGCEKDARKTGKLYNFHFSTLLRLQRYYLIKIQSAFNTLCISNYKINRVFKKQFVFLQRLQKA